LIYLLLYRRRSTGRGYPGFFAEHGVRKLAFIVVFGLWTPLVALAQPASVYQVTVPVDDHSVEARDQALSRALEQVLVRVSGESDVARQAGASDVLGRARQLVKRFGYTGGGEPEEGETPEPLMLEAQFDPNAVKREMERARLPIWGGERPRTLIAINTGSGFLTETGEAAASLKAAAGERGLPLAFPTSSDARQRLSATDIQSGFFQPLNDLQREYGASYALAGELQPAGGNWRGRWQLIGPSGIVDSWQSQAGSLAQLQTDAMNHLAGRYASQFAVRAGQGGGSTVVAVDRVSDLQTYARVLNFISRMTAVGQAIPLQVTGQSAVFRLELAGSTEQLRSGMALAGWLTEDDLARETALLFSNGNALGYRVAR
jgi:hypothetical protein